MGYEERGLVNAPYSESLCKTSFMKRFLAPVLLYSHLPVCSLQSH
uniref:Uncharacterized protein n=1 Tax=uncultured alpha proteobacterium HF0130_06E21 TaxID=710808 RepID=E0XSZ4_9PROT|nr:hypothetical protein [uncultured alpha proteobacterium HF0130_06E21]